MAKQKMANSDLYNFKQSILDLNKFKLLVTLPFLDILYLSCSRLQSYK